MRTDQDAPHGLPPHAIPAPLPRTSGCKINISHFGDLPDEAGISVKVIAALTGNGVSTIWRYKANDPTFPPSIKLSARCTRFRVGDVRAWLAGREAA